MGSFNPLCLTNASRMQLSTSSEAGTIPSARYTNQSGSFSSKVCILGSPGRHHHRFKVEVEVMPVSKVTTQSSCTEAGLSQENSIFKRWSDTGCSGGFRSITWSRPQTTCREEVENLHAHYMHEEPPVSEEQKHFPTCTLRKCKKDRALTDIAITKMFRLEGRCLVTRTSSCSTSCCCR